MMTMEDVADSDKRQTAPTFQEWLEKRELIGLPIAQDDRPCYYECFISGYTAGLKQANSMIRNA